MTGSNASTGFDFVDSPLLAGFAKKLATEPAEIALVMDGVPLTFAELAMSVQQIETRLSAERGSQQVPGLPGLPGLPRLRIAIALPNCVAVASWYLACVKQRYSLFILDENWPAETRKAAIDLVDPDVLVSRQSEMDPDAAEMPDQQHGGVRVKLEHRRRKYTGELPLPASPAKDGDPDYLFFGGFTSGSSGTPKAFVRTVDSWLESFKLSCREFSLTSGSLQFAPGPLSHGLSLYAMAECFFSGAVFVSQRKFNAQECTRLLLNGSYSACEKPFTTINLVLVPTMLYRMLTTIATNTSANVCNDTNNQSKAALPTREQPTVRIITAGAKLGATLKKRLKAAFPATSLSEYYGASELSFVSVNHDTEERPDASVGRLFHGVELAVLDAHGHLQSTGTPGRLHVQSDMLAAGYLEQNEAGFYLRELAGNAAWSSVGDQGYIDESGNLYLLEREDRMLISGGLNVYPSRVEQIIEELIDSSVDGQEGEKAVQLFEAVEVEHCAVTGLKHEQWGEQVCLVVAGRRIFQRFREKTADDANDWRHRFEAACYQLLEVHEVPRRFFVTQQMPMTGSGKVAYRRLGESLAACALIGSKNGGSKNGCNKNANAPAVDCNVIEI